jgi:hypothetical protein
MPTLLVDDVKFCCPLLFSWLACVLYMMRDAYVQINGEKRWRQPLYNMIATWSSRNNQYCPYPCCPIPCIPWPMGPFILHPLHPHSHMTHPLHATQAHFTVHDSTHPLRAQAWPHPWDRMYALLLLYYPARHTHAYLCLHAWITSHRHVMSLCRTRHSSDPL